MPRVKITSFQELTMELVRQQDGQTSFVTKEVTRVDIDTTDSIFGNIMPCSFPNPEQIMEGIEDELSRQWDRRPVYMKAYVPMKAGEPKFAYIKRVMAMSKQSWIESQLRKAYS